MQRQPSQRLSLDDFHKSKYVQTEGEYEPNYIITDYAHEVSRIKSIGTVVDSPRIFEESGYSILLLDDGTETVSCFAYRELASHLESIQKGDIVQVVGKVGEWDGEKRLNLESVTRMGDPNWLTYHKLASKIARKKAISNFGKVRVILDSTGDVRDAKKKAKDMGIDPNVVVSIHELEDIDKSQNAEDEPKIEGSIVDDVKKALEESDDGQGVSLATLKEKFSQLSEDKIKFVLKDLLTTGDVFEPRVGHFSLVLY